jgi:hypothetical protein
VIVAIGIAGFQKANDIRSAQVFSTFNTATLITIVFASGICTVVACIIGFIGAWKRNLTMLKFYSVFIITVILIQLAMGIYLTTLDVNDLRVNWYQQGDSDEGIQRRKDFQNFLECCGFDYWYDSLGVYQTPCPFAPSTARPDAPSSCKDAARAYIKKWVAPVAAAAVAIACLEIAALGATLYIVMKNRAKNYESAFDY